MDEIPLSVIFYLIIDLIITLFCYMAIPIFIKKNNKTYTNKEATKISLLNSIGVCIFFILLRKIQGIEQTTINFAPATFYYFINKKYILKNSSNPMGKNEMPIIWLKFYIYWLLPLSILLNVIAIISLINSLSPNNIYTILFETIYGIITIIYPFIVYIYSFKWHAKAYYLLYSKFILEIILTIIVCVLYNKNILPIILGSIIFATLNIIYLRKRKKFFNNNAPLFKIKKHNILPKKDVKNTKKKDINYNAILIVLCSLIIVIFLFAGIYSLTYYIASLKSQIKTSQNLYSRSQDSYNNIKEKYSTLKKEYEEKEEEYTSKIEFFDEHVVFVIEGYGNYYYTYDEMEQVTQGKNYSFWAYNIDQAKNLGYKAFSSSNSSSSFKDYINRNKN